MREKKRRNQDGSVVTYLQLVENRRVEGKTRQRVLCTLVRADDPKLRADLGRLASPGSKCATYAWSEDVYGAGFEEVELHDLYRALDELCEKKEALEQGWFARHRDPFTDTDLLYFDTTSTYLEGVPPEDLAQFGYSRDKRGDRRQLALGVVVTRDGLPVAHLLLPVNTADPAAFREALSYLREVLGMTRAVLCCDRGMVLERNLDAMREAGLPYIVATRLRGSTLVTEEVLARAGRYEEVAENLRVKEVNVDGAEDRYIVCLNPLRAEEDRRNRDGILAHLEE
ncbi:IS1634 family transposase, partial [Candidatus Bipolaricaulota bacterium]|nr:IS1634 family transposase [Candidatus Bipolaricaulota bacterium]